jgi:hypothetical protein
MKTLPLIACLLAASPAFSQPRVYTNADLGQPLSPNRVTVTPEQLASLAAHQFRMPMTFDGPTAVSSGSSPTAGPFGGYQQTILPRRLDGSLWTDPPWESISYYPSYYSSYYGRSAHVPYLPYAAGPHLPSGAGPRGPRGHGGRRPTAGHGSPGHASRGR